MNKNILLIILLCVSLGILSSCKQDYNCTCNIGISGTSTQTFPIVYVIPNATSSEARVICKGYEMYSKDQSIQFRASDCKLLDL